MFHCGNRPDRSPSTQRSIVHQFVLTRVACILFFLAAAFGSSPAHAAAAAAEAARGALSGVVRDAAGRPLPGATLSLEGPIALQATSDVRGAFTLTDLPPGLYTLSAAKPGYADAGPSAVTILAGVRGQLSIALGAASLREVGRVRAATEGGPAPSPASIAQIPARTFADQSQFQVERILDQTPGVVILHPGSRSDGAAPGSMTYPSVRGALAFETATTIDGHPILEGAFGDYATTFLNANVLSGVAIDKGPGTAANRVNFAINGSVDFRTREPARNASGLVTFGEDSHGGSSSSLLSSGATTNGRLGWVLQYAVNGTPGAVGDASGLVNLPTNALIGGVAQKPGSSTTSSGPSNPALQAGPPYANSTLVGCCESAHQTFVDKAFLGKLRYDLSNATQASFTYLGSYALTQELGNQLSEFVQNFSPGATYAGALKAGSQVVWPGNYPPSNLWENSSQPLFEFGLHTKLERDTLEAQWYSTSIDRLRYNAVSGPNASFSDSQSLYGTFTNAAGNTVTYDGQSVPITVAPSGPLCKNAAGYWVTCAAGAAPVHYSSSPYSRSTRDDRLAGVSFEYDHPLGASANVLAFGYDRADQWTHLFDYDGSPNAPSVPAGSRQSFQTFLARGSFEIAPRLNLTLANYFETYDQRYSTDLGLTAAQAAAIPGAVAGTLNPNATFTERRTNRYDGRAGLTYRASADTSLRFSLGSAAAPPYLGLLNVTTTTPALSSDGTYYANTVSTGAIEPETAFGYDLGADFRIGAGRRTFGTVDLYRTTLFNQFVGTYFANGTYDDGTHGAQPLYSNSYANLAKARYEGIEVALRRDPARGLGFVAQGALLRAYPYDISPCFYSTTVKNGVLDCTQKNINLSLVPDVNFYSGYNVPGKSSYLNSVSPNSIPYAQAYGELHYRFPSGTYLSFGEQLYGNNNSLNLPAFWVGNATARTPLSGDGRTTLQFSADNLFNTYGSSYITTWAGAGVPLVNGKIGLTDANTIGPRLLRFSLTRTFGG
jgi:hypothetical protein